MIYLTIDDTDMPGTPGTNQFARRLATVLADRYNCVLIVRHQLLVDPRVPYTSKNSSASLLLEPQRDQGIASLIPAVREFVARHMQPGSDPGFCVTENSVPEVVSAFGEQCQRQVVTQAAARELATANGIHLEGCGGTDDGVIGALAAVGLVARGNDGRVVQIGDWPDDLSGWQDIQALRERNVLVRSLDTGEAIELGLVDVGKHLRPNYRDRRIVLHANATTKTDALTGRRWQAVRFT